MIRKIRNLIYYSKNEIIPISIIIIFFFIRYSSFAVDLYFPDEVWHTGYMSNLPNLQNYQGFGSTYWMFGKLLSNITENYQFVLRILSLISICISSFFVNQLFKYKTNLNFLFLIFYLTIPFLWYEGKLITPEFYILPFVFYAIKRILIDNKLYSSFLIIGFCIGIKSSIFPIIFPLGIYLFSPNLREISKVISYFKIILSTIVGFVIASPNILWNPLGFYLSIPRRFNFIGDISNSGIPEIFSFQFYLNKLTDFFSQGSIISREWDLVISTGFFATVISLFGFIVLSIFILYYSNRFNKLSYLISIIFFVYIMLLNAYYLWHYYSIIPILVFYLGLTINEDRNKNLVNSKNFKFILSFILSFCIINNLNNVLKFSVIDSNLKKNTFSSIVNFSKSNSICIKEFIKTNLKKQSIILNATNYLETSKGSKLLNSKYIESEYYKIFALSNLTEDEADFIKNYNGDNIYIITFEEYDKLNNFDRSKVDNYINTYVSMRLDKKIKSTTIKKCNNINLKKIEYIDE